MELPSRYCNYDPNKKITVLIADDHPVVRQSLRNTIEEQTDMEVIAEAEDGRETVDLALDLVPDIITMDIGMPVINGLEATRLIKAKCPNIAILVFTVYTDREYIFQLLEAGAAGYLTKEVYAGEIVSAIRMIVAGESVLTPSVLKEIIQNSKPRPPKLASNIIDYSLSQRELFLLKLAAEGLSNKNIAIEMNISANTVKSYLVQLFTKMDVSSRTEAVVKGLRHELIKFSDLD